MNMGITLVKKDDLLFKIIYIALIFYMFAFSETIVQYILKLLIRHFNNKRKHVK